MWKIFSEYSWLCGIWDKTFYPIKVDNKVHVLWLFSKIEYFDGYTADLRTSHILIRKN
jgi:hypothetical protein